MRRSEPGSGAPDWIDAAVPPVPAELAERLRVAGTGAERPSADALAEAATGELASALALGRGREGAFHLLAADGLLTLSCEEVLSGELPVRALTELVHRATAVGSADDKEPKGDGNRRPGG